MFSWLKKHFIPHEGNDHRPHLLRGDAARGIVLMVVFFEAALIISSAITFGSSAFLAAVFPAVLGNLTNIEREKGNLSDLAPSAVLDLAASMKARDMAEKGYFAHTSPEGKTPWYWLDQAGYNYEYAGENLAVNFTDSKDVTEAWMNSPAHRANIEKAAYTEVGTGIAVGTFEGAETIFVAQLYAKPARTLVAAAAKAPVPVAEVPAQAVAKVSTTPAATTNTTETFVLGAETTSMTPAAVANAVSFWDDLRASPRHTMNIILSILGSFVAFAVVLKLVMSMRAHHVDLVANGLCVLAVIGAVYLANVFIFQGNSRIAPATSFEAIQARV